MSYETSSIKEEKKYQSDVSNIFFEEGRGKWRMNRWKKRLQKNIFIYIKNKRGGQEIRDGMHNGLTEEVYAAKRETEADCSQKRMSDRFEKQT